MKIRSQVGMVLNLDKCIGCHTCSVTCKNVWTGREGMEYAWFNNVETKPGIGYPKNWEDQEVWEGGWVRDVNGKIRPRLGGKMGVITKIFANPVIPQIDDYYEPFTFDYQHLHNAPEENTCPPPVRVRLSTASGWIKSSGAPTGKSCSAASLKSAPATVTSTRFRRRCTASLKIPS